MNFAPTDQAGSGTAIPLGSDAAEVIMALRQEAVELRKKLHAQERDNSELSSALQRELAAAQKGREADRRLALVVQGSDDAIISKDLTGTITSWNPGAERIFGFKAEEMVGKSIRAIIPADRHDEEDAILSRLRHGERIDHFETLRQRKDGRFVHVSITVSPVHDDAGRIIGASKIARDITEQQKTAAALEALVSERTASLRQAIEQMEEFSYSVSHDLRSPVRAMRGYAEALLADYGERLGEDGRNLLRRIERNGHRMDQLIQDLLTYSRIARLDVALERVSLERLVKEVIEHYPELRPDHATIEIGGPLPDVLAHEPSLTQAVSNLLSNAVKFVPADVRPRVRVGFDRTPRGIRLWVRDNGIGVAPELQPRLFGMFERMHPGQKYEGTGIGLAIVRKAIERMHGAVGMESDGRSGSRFWFELPAAENA